MSDDLLLRVDGVKKYFPIRGGVFHQQVGQVHAVDGVSLQVKQGETLGLVGESGCGKSTLAKVLLRLNEPTAGEIYFEGKNLLQCSRKEMRSLRREMQIIFQDPSESLNSRHTIGALLAEPFVIHKLGNAKQRQQWVKELLEKVGLSADMTSRFPHEFSGGQKQRIGIARAIALKPKLIVCDEPVSALDVSIQSQIVNLLLNLQKEMGLTLVFIAHNLSVVKHVSDKVAVMYLGKIVELADSEAIYKKPLHPYTQSLIAAIPEADPKQRAGFKVLEGEVPSPINPPSGCRFRTRCPYVQAICQEQEPELKSLNEEDHVVACHFAGDFLVQKNA